MKRVTVVGLLLPVFLFCQNLQAARFWIAAGPSNWNNTANWSAASGGAGGSSVPGIGDDINFDGLGPGSCTIDFPVSVKSITIAPGYAGTISQGANAISTVNAAAFSGGTFNGGTANITVGGSFTLSGTAFTSTSGILEMDNNTVAFTSATFTHNNGTVRLNYTGIQTMTGTGPVFFTLQFVGAGSTYNITSAGNLTVMNSLNLTGAQQLTINSGTIDVKGDINSTNTNTGDGGSAQININGVAAQNFIGSAVSGTGALPQLTINKAAGTLSLSGFPAVANNFIYTAGTISAGTSTFCFTRGSVNAYAITGSVTLNNISFNLANVVTATIGAATVLTAAGDLTIAGAGSSILNSGTINVNGNINLTNTGNGGGGSATINIVGAGAETLDGSAIVVNQSRLPIININKAGGTLSLLGNISFSANVTYTAGTIAPGTSTCYVVNNLSFAGIFSLYNLTIQPAGNTNVTITAGSVVTATNNLDLENGANFININTGTIAVQGNIVDNNSGLTGGGTGTILINGAAAQTISSNGIIDQGRFPAVTINKTSGTLTFPSLITVVGNWTYTSGTLDVTTNSSTVVFANNLTISGNHNLNNIIFEGSNNYTFTVAPATTLTVLGNMAITGTFNTTFATGTINLIGDLNLTNTATGGGGSTVIDFTGTTNQAINSTLLVNQSTLPAVTINKPSGILTFPALITVFGNWTFVAGLYDVSTNNSTVEFAGNVNFTGSHSLNNVVFEATNNWTFTVNTGTIVTVTGTLTTTGIKNIFFSTPVTGTTAIQAQGDIIINNTSVTGGGTALILINGSGSQAVTGNAGASQGLLPFIKVQKPSGTLTLNGTISVARDWTWLSGTVLPTTSSLIFGGNSLIITSAGMSFYNVTVTTNTSTLASSLTVLNNLSITGAAILSAGANTINLAGNWSNWGTGGFTEAASTVNFNGSSLQTITTPAGENFTNVIVNNSGSGIQIANAVAIATSLTMTQGNIDLNSKTLTLGLSAVNNGTLSRVSGTIINTGSFIRWFKTAIVADGSAAGLFPMGTAVDYRPIFISAPAVAPITGGTVAATYTDATTNTTVSFPDAPFAVVVRKDLNWALTTAGLAGGTYNMQIQGTDFGLIGAVSDLRLTLVNSVVATAGVNAGTVANPTVIRTGLTAANLSNTFFLGSINAVSTPLPVTLVSFTALLKNAQVDLRWETATETQNDFFTVLRSANGSDWTSIAKIPGKGNTGPASFYESVDEGPLQGKSFYRLENTDFDGHSYFSAIIMVNNDGAPNHISIYPNPVSNILVITRSGNESFTIEVYNSLGQAMRVVPNNISTSSVDVSGLPAGIYFVHILVAGNSLTRTIVVRR